MWGSRAVPALALADRWLASWAPALLPGKSESDAAMQVYARGACDPLALLSPSSQSRLAGGSASGSLLAAAAATGAAPADLAALAAAPAPGGGEAAGLVEIGYGGVALSSCLLAVSLAISMWLRLNLEVKLVVAALRCVVQLSALGYILVPIFRANSWWVVLMYSAVMLLVAASEAAGRPAYGYKGLFFTVLLGLGSAASLTLTYTLLLVIGVRPWYEAQYFIPLLGMLLGNAVNGVSVGLATVMEELSAGKDRVELLLALGATRLEAARSLLRHSLTIAMTPLLNQMSVVGIVSIPGMMTGQILGGSDPSQAAYYQIMIMFLVSATGSFGSMVAVLGTVLAVIDSEHRLRSERLLDRQGRSLKLTGAINWLVQGVVEGIGCAVRGVAGGVLAAARAVARCVLPRGEDALPRGEDEENVVLLSGSTSLSPQISNLAGRGGEWVAAGGGSVVDSSDEECAG